jgi:hypothetical protein
MNARAHAISPPHARAVWPPARARGMGPPRLGLCVGGDGAIFFQFFAAASNFFIHISCQPPPSELSTVCEEETQS